MKNINKIQLIGVHGPLNGGKDTVATYIIHKFPTHFIRYAFARPIKEACKVLFGFTQAQLEDRVLKELDDKFWGFSPRKAMQLLGTEYGRDMLRKDIWIKRAEMECINNLQQGCATVITDVRFENEAEWLRAQPNSMLIYLEVPGLVKDSKYQHGSEAGIRYVPEFDIKIINDKSKGLQSLYDQLDHILFDPDEPPTT